MININLKYKHTSTNAVCASLEVLCIQQCSLQCAQQFRSFEIESVCGAAANKTNAAKPARLSGSAAQLLRVS